MATDMPGKRAGVVVEDAPGSSPDDEGQGALLR